MSIHFNVASALLHGDFHDRHYRDFGNADITALAGKVSVVIDDALTAAYPGNQGANVIAITKDGKFSAGLEDVIAASTTEISERFLDAAAAVIGQDAAASLQKVVAGLADSPDVNALVNLPDPL
jgi:hypothetical protein